jgi:Iap family predicted aminopeptidase
VLTQDAIAARLKQFSGSDQERESRLKGWFREAGCAESQTVEQKVSSGLPPNLICTLPGETDSIILVGAHFDYVPRGEGVVDNWSGASLLPSFASTLTQRPRHHTFILIAFSGEERGLVGSEFYAKHLNPAQRERIAAVINLDSLGLAPTEVWASRADPQLVRVLNAVAHAMNLPLSAMNVDNAGSTDSESFAPYKIPRITIHSVTQDTWHVLHSPGDQFSAIHLGDYYSTYRLLTAYLVELDQYLRPKGDPTAPQTPTPNSPAAPPS